MTRLRTTAIALSLLTLLCAAARADEPDEPGLVPAPHHAPPEQAVDIEHPRPANDFAPSPPPVVWVRTETGTPRPSLQPMARDSDIRVALDAGAGYGGFAGLFGLYRVHGPAFCASMSTTFGGTRVRHGIRFAGTYGYRWTGTSEPLFGESSKSVESRFAAGQAGYLAQFQGGGWLSAGLGLFDLRVDTDSDSVTLPEAYVAGGYDVHLGRHLALRLAAEVGTLVITWRAQATGSLQVRF
jgi:hypothetical protein